MNNKIMLSIHHEHSELIYSGKKTLEIRKNAPRRKSWGGGIYDTIFLYETKQPYRGTDGLLYPGEGAVTGFFLCKAYEATNAFTSHDFYKKEEIRNSFILQSCLTEDKLEKYAQDSTIYGWKVNTPIRFPHPIPLSDFGLTRAPQSWQYLK